MTATAPTALPAPANLEALGTLNLQGLKPSGLIAKNDTRPALASALLQSHADRGIQIVATDSFRLGVCHIKDPDPALPDVKVRIGRATMRALEGRRDFTVHQALDGLYAKLATSGVLLPLIAHDEGYLPFPVYESLIPDFEDTPRPAEHDHRYVGLQPALLASSLSMFGDRPGGGVRLQFPKSPISPFRVDKLADDANSPSGTLLLVMPLRLNA